ncbi:uncharacterized protein LOC132758024 [Ruditapes philippinarum]|uniref:uncharacterized protein LOC132758024 n=1 Tax=Ruditapes philippinarum TaxID=129788 RepID=UPI00295BC2BA|nr:uncharacterized protein LOC132758024 [Ruditapes philippinarum]
MSTNKTNTKAEALKLKHEVDAIAVIGVGNEVLHQELLDIASDPSFVYSVNNFNSLYTVLRQLVQLCDECETSMATDVAIFLDSSYYITTDQFNLMVDAIMHIIDAMNHLNLNGTHVSVTTFSNDIKSIMNMGETFNKNVIKSKVNMVSKSPDEHQELHLETVFAYVRDKIFNNTFSLRIAKKFLLIFTNGKAHVNSKSTFESEKSILEADGVNIVAVGSGEDIDMNGLIKIVTDTFNVFVTTHDLPMNNLDILQSEFVNSKCNITGE